MVKSAAKKVISDSSVFESRRESDTIKVWENYRDQATLWRAIGLLQIPATCIALIFALVMWSTRSITLDVPAKPLPGLYAALDIPDTEFIDTATNFLNLTATYQYNIARRQFTEAAKMLQEPMLSRFVTEILGSELKTVESTNRTQVFFVDPTSIEVDRSVARNVTVRMSGERLKVVAGKELPLVKTRFSLTMTTVPHNKLNQYGIVITDFGFENLEK